MVASVKLKPQKGNSPKKLIPPLQFGDRLTRSEFHRRYRAMPNLKKAELTEGRVFKPSPVSQLNHSKPHSLIMGCLFNYCAATSGVDLGDNATVILDPENEVQPDGLLFNVNGSSSVNDAGYLEGPPELIIEIFASTASYDTHDKYLVYRRSQVQEYIIWRVLDEEIDWYYLDNGEYKLLKVDESGIIKSMVFPGFWLDINALFKHDLPAVPKALNEGAGSDKHSVFAQHISAQEPTKPLIEPFQ